MAQTGRIHEIATNEIPNGASGKPGTLDQLNPADRGSRENVD
jgi:hypothetical protein